VTNEQGEIIGLSLTFLGIISLLIKLTFRKRNFLTWGHEFVQGKKPTKPDNSAAYITFEKYSAKHSTDILRTILSKRKTCFIRSDKVVIASRMTPSNFYGNNSSNRSTDMKKIKLSNWGTSYKSLIGDERETSDHRDPYNIFEIFRYSLNWYHKRRNFLKGERELLWSKKPGKSDNSAPYNDFQKYSATHSIDILKR